MPKLSSWLRPRPRARAVASAWPVLVLILLLGGAAVDAIATLQDRASADAAAEQRLGLVRADLHALQYAPLEARTSTGGSPAFAHGLLVTGERRVTRTLTALAAASPPPALLQVRPALHGNFATLARIERLGASPAGYGPASERLMGISQRQLALPLALLAEAAHTYAARAASARTQATAGAVVSILILSCAFAFFYRRSVGARATSEELARENERLLEVSREEALTDALTGLHNRRALIADLTALLTAERPAAIVLALFDLDGFKPYNDTFGHPAGDALLERLADRLATVVHGRGTAYRMGGDEFCLVCPADGARAARAARRRPRCRSTATPSTSAARTAPRGCRPRRRRCLRRCTWPTCGSTRARPPAGRRPDARAPTCCCSSCASGAPTCTTTSTASRAWRS